MVVLLCSRLRREWRKKWGLSLERKSATLFGLKMLQVARLSSEASSFGAAIVEAENSNSLDVQVQENKEDLKAKLKEVLREKSDAFKF